MKIAICDDSYECICVLKDYMKMIDHPDIELDTYQDGRELVAAYRVDERKYDAIYLDMEMDGLNGIQTANLIREIDEHVIIVFVTSYNKYMKESFVCQPFRYLLKPVKFDEFDEVFTKIREKLFKKRKVVNFTENKKKIRLYCDEIIYCESRGHHTMIYTNVESFKVRRTISDVYDTIDKETFVRTHKSFLVNLYYVRKIHENNMDLSHYNASIPISRSYKKAVVAAYTNFIEKEYCL